MKRRAGAGGKARDDTTRDCSRRAQHPHVQGRCSRRSGRRLRVLNGHWAARRAVQRASVRGRPRGAARLRSCSRPRAGYCDRCHARCRRCGGGPLSGRGQRHRRLEARHVLPVPPVAVRDAPARCCRVGRGGWWCAQAAPPASWLQPTRHGHQRGGGQQRCGDGARSTRRRKGTRGRPAAWAPPRRWRRCGSDHGRLQRARGAPGRRQRTAARTCRGRRQRRRRRR